MRVISENIANAEFDARRRPAPIPIAARSRPSSAEVDRALDARVVALGPRAHRPVRLPHSSTSPAIRPPTPTATSAIPNVNSLVEMTDMREAQRSYEANINVIGATRRMIQRTLEILKSLNRRPKP